MKKLKNSIPGIVLCALELLVGILLLIDPVGFTSGIIIAAGIALMVLGIISAVRYFRMAAAEAAASRSLAMGLVALLCGGFCAFRSKWFVATFPLLTIIYGVVILVAGMGKVQLTVDMIRQKSGRFMFSAISAALSIICAVIILSSPFASTAVLWKFTGITLIIEALADVVALAAGGIGTEK